MTFNNIVSSWFNHDTPSNSTQVLKVDISSISQQGYLVKCSKYLQVWKTRWCIIVGHWLHTYENKDKINTIEPGQSFDLHIYTQISYENIGYLKDKYAFSLKRPYGTHKILFYAASNSDRLLWIKKIKAAANIHFIKSQSGIKAMIIESNKKKEYHNKNFVSVSKNRKEDEKEIKLINKSEIKSMIIASNKKKEYHNKNFVSVSKINSKKYDKKKEKEIKLTNKILSKPCSGNTDDKDTLLHVLAGYSKLNGKNCLFTDDNSNKNSKFIASMGVENQNCVLALDNLSDVAEESKTEDLKSEILKIQDDLKHKKKNKTVENLKIKLGKAHGVNPKYIRINDVYYGSAHIDYDIITKFNKRGDVTADLKNCFKAYKELKLHPLFFDEKFNVNDFDSAGNKDFGSGSTFDVGPPGYTQKYIQPKGWTRYGLKVLDGRYGGDNKWLDPFQDPGNWYRAFHGTSAESGKLIVGGPNNNQKKAHFKVFDNSRQACEGQQNRNPLSGNGKVGVGTYCTPSPTIADGYARGKGKVTISTTQGPKQFYFMFQVCVDPKKVKFAGGDYWVVPKEYPDAIRPYGILIRQA